MLDKTKMIAYLVVHSAIFHQYVINVHLQAISMKILHNVNAISHIMSLSMMVAQQVNYLIVQ
jgi:hypothetical protein